jgi:hypothetical protein
MRNTRYHYLQEIARNLCLKSSGTEADLKRRITEYGRRHNGNFYPPVGCRPHQKKKPIPQKRKADSRSAPSRRTDSFYGVRRRPTRTADRYYHARSAIRKREEKEKQQKKHYYDSRSAPSRRTDSFYGVRRRPTRTADRYYHARSAIRKREEKKKQPDSFYGVRRRTTRTADRYYHARSAIRKREEKEKQQKKHYYDYYGRRQEKHYNGRPAQYKKPERHYYDYYGRPAQYKKPDYYARERPPNELERLLETCGPQCFANDINTIPICPKCSSRECYCRPDCSLLQRAHEHGHSPKRMRYYAEQMDCKWLDDYNAKKAQRGGTSALPPKVETLLESDY